MEHIIFGTPCFIQQIDQISYLPMEQITPWPNFSANLLLRGSRWFSFGMSYLNVGIITSVHEKFAPSSVGWKCCQTWLYWTWFTQQKDGNVSRKWTKTVRHQTNWFRKSVTCDVDSVSQMAIIWWHFHVENVNFRMLIVCQFWPCPPVLSAKY